jgi:hypothetical protein
LNGNGQSVARPSFESRFGRRENCDHAGVAVQNHNVLGELEHGRGPPPLLITTAILVGSSGYRFAQPARDTKCFNRNLRACSRHACVTGMERNGCHLSQLTEALMDLQGEMKFGEDAIVFAVEADAPIDAWTIDELNQYSELESVRSAWTHSETLREMQITLHNGRALRLFDLGTVEVSATDLTQDTFVGHGRGDRIGATAGQSSLHRRARCTCGADA